MYECLLRVDKSSLKLNRNYNYAPVEWSKSIGNQSNDNCIRN